MDSTTTQTLNDYYRQLLRVGFIVLKQAIDVRDHEWASAEVELLHNIPGLLDEQNIERHKYFWFSERVQYLDTLSATGNEVARSRMQTYYEPIWDEMGPILLELFASAGHREAASASR